MADYGFHGFFALRTPQDLLAKLRHDHTRLTANPVDSYAAFDFFVTANCLVDWVWPAASRKQQRDNRQTEVLPRICQHLADGAKHFLLSTPHKGVLAATHVPAARSGIAVSGLSRSSTSAPTLIVRFDADEAAELGQDVMNVVQLATLVLDYWKRRIGT